MKNMNDAKADAVGSMAAISDAGKSSDTMSAKRSRVPLYRIRLDRTGSIVKEGARSVTCSREAAHLFREFIGDAPVEHFCMVALDSRRRAIGLNEISVGTISASLVHPRETFKTAILLNAAAIIVAHNHPSGDPTPSSEDRDATRRLTRAGELLGIPVADHIVIAEESGEGLRYYSFRDHGLM